MPDETPPRSPSVDRLRYVLWAGLLLLAAWVLADVLLMIFAAVLLAIAYRGCAGWVAAKSRLPMGVAMALLALASTAAIAAGIWWGGSSLAAQAGQLWAQLEAEWRSLRATLQDAGWGRRILQDLQNERFLGGVDTLAGQFAGAAITTFGIFGSLLIVVISAIYLAADPGLYRRGLLMLLPVDRRERGAEVLDEIGDALKAWLIGRAVEMLAVTALTFAGLMLLGVPLALMLAIVAGVLNFVPYIGAIAGAIPAVVVAFGQGPMQALWVALLFLAIQTVEGYLLTPQVQQRTVQLPPAVTIFSQTVFGTLFGLLGLLLAPALAAVLLVAVRSVYVREVLGDRGSSEA